MREELVVYSFGLVLVIFYIMMGIDDFIWDMISLYKKKKKTNEYLYMCELSAVEPKMIAVMIGAWREDNVLEAVIDNIIMTQIYPRSMYHVFIGVYPNDYETINVVKKLEKKYESVHCVINKKAGPTSKSQNLNHIIREILLFEKKYSCKFASFSVHDSEDIVHPYELSVTNYLIDHYAALQFPVFPIIEEQNFGNFLKQITTNTYADEFAENHFITMVNRHRLGAFVPSAGTGFSLRREIIEKFGENLFPENSSPEDYRLSLSLYEMGIQMYYVLESIKRVTDRGEIKWEYIATRSLFPNTFEAAVKQKTRWILGITMQSAKIQDVFMKKIPIAGKYSLYKDQKAKIGNLLFGIGYPVVIYVVLSLFIPLPIIYPKFSLSWYLCVFVSIMMFERQLFRAIALYNIYGSKMVFFGILFPPLMPIRIIWGNIINFTATIRAYQRIKEKKNKYQISFKKVGEWIISRISTGDLCHNKVTKEKEVLTIKWDKTNHDFVSKDYLKSYQRLLGDILVAKNYLSCDELSKIFRMKENHQKLGKYLLDNYYIQEDQLVEALAIVNHEPYVKRESLNFYAIYELFLENRDWDYKKYRAIPILQNSNRAVFIYSKSSHVDLFEKILEYFGEKFYLILVSDSTMKFGMNIIETKTK